MEASGRRPWRANVALTVLVLWCVAVWLGVLHLLGVPISI
jgi:hypothetical protein